MTFAIAGTGNMAWFIGTALAEKGFTCTAVWGRNTDAANELAGKLQSAVAKDIHAITSADVCVLAVSDNAIASLAAQLATIQPATTFIHTSGAVPLDVLSAQVKNAAVLWPLYSILKNAAPRNFPCALEANNDIAKLAALNIAAAFTNNVFTVDSMQRQWLHLSAVMSNNFINHLVAICTEICQQQNLPFNVLKPIIQQTFERLENANAADVQTGPARRGDFSTMQKHIALLQTQPQWQAVYKALSASIENMYGIDHAAKDNV